MNKLDFRTRRVGHAAHLPGALPMAMAPQPVIQALERHSHNKAKVPVPMADPDPADCFLGGHSGPCVDAAGYHRRRHEYAVWTRRGWRCLWCSRFQHEVGR